MAVKHNSEIKFKVGLDENKVPEDISWTAKDGGIDNEASKAIMISVWDHKTKDTLKMDLSSVLFTKSISDTSIIKIFNSCCVLMKFL